jgi:hypothetical protein
MAWQVRIEHPKDRRRPEAVSADSQPGLSLNILHRETAQVLIRDRPFRPFSPSDRNAAAQPSGFNQFDLIRGLR